MKREREREREIERERERKKERKRERERHPPSFVPPYKCVLSVCISAFSQPTVYTGYSGIANTIEGDLHRKGDSLLHVDHITSQFI
jgi:hypothetical protein